MILNCTGNKPFGLVIADLKKVNSYRKTDIYIGKNVFMVLYIKCLNKTVEA